MLCNSTARANKDECRSRGNVEGMRTVTSCTDNIVNGLVTFWELDFYSIGTHGTHRTCDLRNRFAFHAKCNEIGADLRGSGLTRHDDIHDLLRFLGSQVSAIDGFG